MVLDFTEDDWQEEANRQKKFDVHKKTQTIPLLFSDGPANPAPTLLPRYSLFADVLSPVFKQFAAYFTNARKTGLLHDGNGRGYPVNVLIVKLLAHGEITPHMDSGFGLAHAHRIHVPIITNNKVTFTVGDSNASMEEGTIWEINNRHLHAVKNQTASDRVHLIIDWRIKNQSCCCGPKRHPGTPCTPENCESEAYMCDCFA